MKKINGKMAYISFQSPFCFKVEEALEHPEAFLEFGDERWDFESPEKALEALMEMTGRYDLALKYEEDMTANYDYVVHCNIVDA